MSMLGVGRHMREVADDGYQICVECGGVTWGHGKRLRGDLCG